MMVQYGEYYLALTRTEWLLFPRKAVCMLEPHSCVQQPIGHRVCSGVIQEIISLIRQADITAFLSAGLKIKVGHPVDQIKQTEGSWKKYAGI